MAVGPERPSGWLWILLIAAAMVLGLAAGAHPTLADTAFVVNTPADAVDANIGDGLCRTAANKCSLRAAIQEANADPDLTTITLKEKIYKIKLDAVGEDAGATGDFDISSSITIIGVNPAKTVIDANFLDRAFHLHSGGTLELYNLTIRNGFSTEQGGAIAAEVDGVMVIADNVVFRGNTSAVMGGAVIASGNGIFKADNTKFIDNLAPLGGAVYFYQAGQSEIYHSLFDDNTAERGGAIASYFSAVVIEHTRFEDNLAECYTTPSCDPLMMEGGAIYAGNYEEFSGGSFTLYEVEFHRNASTGWSGGFSVYNTQFQLDFATFDSNTAVNGSGAGYTFGSSGHIRGASFTNNTATGTNGAGGAVYLQDSAMTVEATTFSGNSAYSGGGLYVSGDAPPRLRVNDSLIQHVTFANNSAVDGGGLWLVDGSGGLTVVGSIFSGNTASSLGPDCGGAIITVSWSLISNDTHCVITGTNNIINEPVGLDVLSYGVNGTSLAHVPMMASPVLDAEAACTIFTDQHGNYMPLGEPCTLGAVSGSTRNLLSNESFESGVSGWKVKSADGKDKAVNTMAYAGNRAFLFKGVSGKTASLRQVVNSPILTAFSTGHDVCASGMFYSKNVNGQNLTVQVLVRYSDGVVAKSVQPVTLTAGEYSLSCSGIVTIDLTGGRTISKIEARIISKSTKGKTFVDNVSLTWYTDILARAEAGATRAGVLSLPDAPDGFRR